MTTWFIDDLPPVPNMPQAKCWAAPLESEYPASSACGKPTTSPCGLCDEHIELFRGT